jgi:hypothetical protein
MRLVPFRHPVEGFAIPFPDGWERIDDVDDVALVVAEPEHPPWFRANLVVTVEATDIDDLDRWAEESVRALEDLLDDLHVVDVERTEIAGFATRRTLAHHDAGGHAVTLEQWAVLAGGLGFVISASVATLEYAAYADAFAEIAAGFRPDV